ncbi:MAG TPA: hypothetical protein VHN99_00555, partial [Deinococcales bacterium]|nr:hypothetical protein [Deinococcales bacterium]
MRASRHFSLLAFALVLFSFLPALAAPFTLTASGPVDVLPGVNVLAFTLSNPGPDAVTVGFSVDAPPGLSVLAAPDGITVDPGDEALVPVTVVAGSGLPAGEARVTLTATGTGGVVSAAGVLRVPERHALALALPAVTSGGVVRLSVRNDGNVLDSVSMNFTGTGRDAVAPAAAGPFALKPGESADATVMVTAVEPGAVVVNATSTGGGKASGLTRVLPDAAAAPAPFRLAGSLDVNGPWPLSAGVTLSGALSDETTFDARVSGGSSGAVNALVNFNWFGFKPFGATAVTSLSLGQVGDDALGTGFGVSGWGARARLSLLQSPNALGSAGLSFTGGGAVLSAGGRFGFSTAPGALGYVTGAGS